MKIETFVKKANQLTLQNIINGQYYDNKKGWIKVPKSIDTDHLIEMAVGVIGGNKKGRIRMMLKHYLPQHWAIDRVHFDLGRSGKIYCSYCAGQDYPYELNQLRKYLYK